MITRCHPVYHLGYVLSLCITNSSCEFGFTGHVVAQLRVIFQPVFPGVDHPQILAYVEPLIPVSHIRHENGSEKAIPDENSGLFEVKRLYRPDHSTIRYGD